MKKQSRMYSYTAIGLVIYLVAGITTYAEAEAVSCAKQFCKCCTAKQGQMKEWGCPQDLMMPNTNAGPNCH